MGVGRGRVGGGWWEGQAFSPFALCLPQTQRLLLLPTLGAHPVASSSLPISWSDSEWCSFQQPCAPALAVSPGGVPAHCDSRSHCRLLSPVFPGAVIPALAGPPAAQHTVRPTEHVLVTQEQACKASVSDSLLPGLARLRGRKGRSVPGPLSHVSQHGVHSPPSAQEETAAHRVKLVTNLTAATSQVPPTFCCPPHL